MVNFLKSFLSKNFNYAFYCKNMAIQNVFVKGYKDTLIFLVFFVQTHLFAAYRQ